MTQRSGATIAVLGGNGVYARHLIPRLAARGFRVRALVRRPEAAGVARACGAEIHAADIFDGASLAAALAGCDVGVNLATSLPGPSGRGDWDANDRLRRDGTPIWVSACRSARVPRILQQSIAMVNASGGDAWSDEDTVYAPGEDSLAARAIAAARAMEDAVSRSELDWLILRGGLFYGRGRASTTTGSRARAPASCGCQATARASCPCSRSRIWPRRRSPPSSAGRRGAR